jgi:hypothetical protein
MMKRFDPFLFLALSLLLFFILSAAAGQDMFTENLLKNFTFRSLGPYRAGSWVTSVAVPEKPLKEHLYTFYIGTRNGGVWKTVNNGTTFEPVFDGQSRLSIGDVAVAPSNSQVIWVGTGESYCTRSSHSGDGVYKSVDGGKTWIPMGLPDSHHIARIIVHPRNPEVVYVAAMGHLFTPNAERGVFKTIDGGRTWKKVLYISDKIGVIDLVQDRRRPEILYAAAYDKVRLPWHYEAGGPESAVYKTENAGKSWRRLSGGLPTGRGWGFPTACSGGAFTKSRAWTNFSRLRSNTWAATGLTRAVCLPPTCARKSSARCWARAVTSLSSTASK